jgi:selenocysteine lyase/cysteine desulfurase
MSATTDRERDLVIAEHAERDFLARFPNYAATAALDDLRAREFARLDANGHVYLDYTGGGLYGDSQVHAHSKFLTGSVFGNPHSGNPASLDMTDYVEATRARVLSFFNASPGDYTAIFTQNASGALKLVGESYPFRPGGCFALSADNHNSVNGIREFAHHSGADVAYVPLDRDELRLDLDALDSVLGDERWSGHRLFAFPAQSNYSGVKHPLSLVERAHEAGWDVVLDCAAYAPTSPIDLSVIDADFACFSFYKMFGYPTGVGALIAKTDKLLELDRPWFAGGTIQIASVKANDHFMASGEAAFEDGTVNYLTIPALQHGFDLLEGVGMDTISTRVACLSTWLLEEMQALRHDNGRPLVQVHGPKENVARGGTITSNLVDPQGIPYSGARIEELAGAAMISIRTGCFCNPGAGETAHGVDDELLLEYFNRPTGIGFQQLVTEVRHKTGKELSSIRVSVGVASNFADVQALMAFLRRLRNVSCAELGRPGEQTHLRDSA